ncbi:MAG: hypothetical protein Q7J35_14000 [Candidatus Methanoperedens sp.]|nr:hypothetical protein [Candidatus Methanoperedens sp.]
MDKIKPKIIYAEIEYYLHGFGEKEIENNEIYALARTLSDEALPSYQDKSDTIWEGFYLPVRREGRIIALPFGIHEYNKEFFVQFHLLRNLHIKNGEKESEEFYKNIFSEALGFIPVIKADEKILQKLIPYDIRTGKIKGLYVLDKALSNNSRVKILKDYARHVEGNPEIRGISLNEYLRTAGICYVAAFGKKAESLSPLEMYKKWADGRDGGMLSIKDWDDSKEFKDWLDSGGKTAGHPFEIVFSWHRHGIHLYPPSSYEPCYNLRVTNYAYAAEFVKMSKGLIKENVPFSAHDLKNVLDYLAGETYFTVNGYGEHNFHYIPSKEHKKKFFRYIEWDEIKIPKWKVCNDFLYER